ncbi:MAG: FAD-dependent monooxygenase [Candidatus Eremiobacterota bacterium]
MKLTIAGAGPAGLACALAARARGWEVDLYEPEPDYPRASGTWLLNANGLLVLERLQVPVGDLTLPFREVSIESPGRGTLWTSRLDGAVVVRRPLLARLQRLGLERGARLVAAELRVLNPEAVVVAADGACSPTRRLLGLRAWSGSSRTYLQGLSSAPPGSRCPREIWTRDGARLGLDPTACGRTGFYLTGRVGSDWGRFRDEVRAVMSARQEVVEKRARTVLAMAWTTDRGALVGDAAHAMAPTLGQGANAALVDGELLIELLARGEAGRFARLRRGFMLRSQLLAAATSWISTHPFPLREELIGWLSERRWAHEWTRAYLTGQGATSERRTPC